MAIIPAPTRPTHELEGTRFTSLATPTRGCAETSVWMVEIDPGTPATPHSLTREEVFVVLDGTLTIHMGEGDDPERHELAAGSVLVVQSGTALQLSNRGGTELRLFIYGAPPERGEATFLPTIE